MKIFLDNSKPISHTRLKKVCNTLPDNKITDVNINQCPSDSLEWDILLINEHEFASTIFPKESWLFEVLIKFLLTDNIFIRIGWLKTKEFLLLFDKAVVILLFHYDIRAFIVLLVVCIQKIQAVRKGCRLSFY